VDAGILLSEIKSPSRDQQFERMHQIFEFFEKMFGSHRIEKVCMEKLFFTSHNQQNAEFVYGVRGILLMLAYQHGAEIRERAPLELKKMITGNGKATKEFVQQMVMRLYRLDALPEYTDASDALGLAYVGTKVKGLVVKSSG
jgi:crossover junction endodeoxyribonuclease RuvC